jgi:hypothetical protein
MRVHFVRLKQFRFAVRVARSLRRNFQADPQFQWQADEREAGAQLERESCEHLRRFAAVHSASPVGMEEGSVTSNLLCLRSAGSTAAR